jgi:hypothetical protein
MSAPDLGDAPDHVTTPTHQPQAFLASSIDELDRRQPSTATTGPPVVLLQRRNSMPLATAKTVPTSRYDELADHRAGPSSPHLHPPATPSSPIAPSDPSAFFDDTIVDAYRHSVKDRILLMKADMEMERFIVDPRCAASCDTANGRGSESPRRTAMTASPSSRPSSRRATPFSVC